MEFVLNVQSMTVLAVMEMQVLALPANQTLPSITKLVYVSSAELPTACPAVHLEFARFAAM